MSVTFFEKIKSYLSYKYNVMTKGDPYKKVIDCDNNDHTELMNTIHYVKYPSDINFKNTKRIAISYQGDRSFNTVIHADSFNDVKKIVHDIVNNTSKYSKKSFESFPDFIDKIHIVTGNNVIIDVSHHVNICVPYNCEILIGDILALYGYENIKTIQVTYYKNMESNVIELCFEQYKNKNIDILNEILK